MRSEKKNQQKRLLLYRGQSAELLSARVCEWARIHVYLCLYLFCNLFVCLCSCVWVWVPFVCRSKRADVIEPKICTPISIETVWIGQSKKRAENKHSDIQLAVCVCVYARALDHPCMCVWVPSIYSVRETNIDERINNGCVWTFEWLGSRRY